LEIQGPAHIIPPPARVEAASSRFPALHKVQWDLGDTKDGFHYKATGNGCEYQSVTGYATVMSCGNRFFDIPTFCHILSIVGCVSYRVRLQLSQSVWHGTPCLTRLFYLNFS
jgi:hypothetical protein